MKRQFLTLIASGALAAGMALAQAPATPAPGAPAGTTQHAHRNFRQQRRARFEQQLNLTDAQKAQAKTIFGQARETSKPVREQLKANRQALRAAVKADNRSEIEKLSTARGSLMGKMMAIHSEASAKFYQMLTPEQRAKAEQLHAQFRERVREHRNQKSTS
jgi:Spy/CpxP family protein refolding chaperone